jgi:hypothetical protein
MVSHGALMSIGSPRGSLAQDTQARSSLGERRLSIHGIHSFANSILATANRMGGRNDAIELRSLIHKRNQTNQLQAQLLTSGPGGRRFKSSLPDQSFQAHDPLVWPRGPLDHDLKVTRARVDAHLQTVDFSAVQNYGEAHRCRVVGCRFMAFVSARRWLQSTAAPVQPP